MKASETSILSFVGGLDKVFIIPPFQRNYEWTKKQCEDLFHDIEIAFSKGKTHYLGNIVYYIGENSGADFNEYILVDGQQRITTILLLLCAIRDFDNDSNVGNTVSRRYLLNDTDDEKFRIRLKQTSYDYQNFSDVIEGRKIRNENSHIAENYAYFLKLLKDTKLSLKDVYNTIQKLEVVGVNLQIDNDLEAVQIIFEKINSTGRPLSAADLIRNYLLISSSVQEQEKLYQSYWVEIEKKIETDAISKFARDYLILKTCDDVGKDFIYQDFKNYFNEYGVLHENILQEMLRYSSFYSWIIHQDCPDSKLNKSIEELNVLQTGDCYCLYMYLMERLYDDDIDELRKIFNLLSDYLLRFRIVSVGGSSGALRHVILQLLRKLSNDEVLPKYDDIYFELSNSSSKSGRFPDNEEFKRALKFSKKSNHRYGKVLLRKIEEFGKKYIAIPLSEITVEHLMPQTPTRWWEDNFGGKENTTIIYDNYLNAIGNLAIMSQGGNAANSNKSWNDKLIQISESQFSITSDIQKYGEWKEEQIKQRNEEIANMACNVIAAPLVRTRPITAITFTSGLYSMSDDSVDLTGANIQYLLYGDKKIDIKAWNQLFNVICKIVYDIDSKKFDNIVVENKIHKSKNSKDGAKKCPFITSDVSDVVLSKKIEGSEYFTESALSAAISRKKSRQILDLYGITEQFSIYVNENSLFED